jgi:hypothetical protein
MPGSICVFQLWGGLPRFAKIPREMFETTQEKGDSFRPSQNPVRHSSSYEPTAPN